MIKNCIILLCLFIIIICLIFLISCMNINFENFKEGVTSQIQNIYANQQNIYAIKQANNLLQNVQTSAQYAYNKSYNSNIAILNINKPTSQSLVVPVQDVGDCLNALSQAEQDLQNALRSINEMDQNIINTIRTLSNSEQMVIFFVQSVTDFAKKLEYTSPNKPLAESITYLLSQITNQLKTALSNRQNWIPNMPTQSIDQINQILRNINIAKNNVQSLKEKLQNAVNAEANANMATTTPIQTTKSIVTTTPIQTTKSIVTTTPYKPTTTPYKPTTTPINTTTTPINTTTPPSVPITTTPYFTRNVIQPDINLPQINLPNNIHTNADFLKVVNSILNLPSNIEVDKISVNIIQGLLSGIKCSNARILLSEIGQNYKSEPRSLLLYMNWFASNFPIDNYD